MKRIRNHNDQRKLLNMQLQLGKYILATYLKTHQETGQLEQTFIVKVTQQNGHLTFKIDPAK